MILILVLKEIIKWRSVLTASVIATLNAIKRLYIEDSREEFYFILFLIGFSYAIYDLAKKMQLSGQEFKWTILKFFNKKRPHAYLHIILFIITLVNGYLFLSLIILVFFVGIFVYSLSISNVISPPEYMEFILHELIPCISSIAFMTIGFRIFLEIWETSRTITEMIFFVISEPLILFTSVFLTILLISYSICTCYVYMKYYDGKHSHYLYLLCSWKFNYMCCNEFSRIFLSLYSPVCLNCERVKLELIWCQNCGKKYLAEHFSKWTSGHKVIDELIRNTQLRSKRSTDFIEWIPYNEFENIQQIGKGGFGTVYSAVWKIGPLDMSFGRIERSSNHNVAIKSLGYSSNITQEFLHEVIIFNSY